MQLSAGAVVLFLGMVLLLGLLVVYASGVGRRAHEAIPDVPTGNPSMERKVVATLGLLILSGLLLTGYSFVEPRRQAEATTRQEGIGDPSRHRELHHALRRAATASTAPARWSPAPIRRWWRRPSTGPTCGPIRTTRTPSTSSTTSSTRRSIAVGPGRRCRPGVATDGGSLLDEQIHELTLMIVKGDTVIQGKPAWELATEIAREKIAHGAPEPQRPTIDLATLPPEAQAGARLFTGKGGCVGCHNAGSGGGATGPNLSHIATDGGDAQARAWPRRHTSASRSTIRRRSWSRATRRSCRASRDADRGRDQLAGAVPPDEAVGAGRTALRGRAGIGPRAASTS